MERNWNREVLQFWKGKEISSLMDTPVYQQWQPGERGWEGEWSSLALTVPKVRKCLEKAQMPQIFLLQFQSGCSPNGRIIDPLDKVIWTMTAPNCSLLYWQIALILENLSFCGVKTPSFLLPPIGPFISPLFCEVVTSLLESWFNLF